ncbi:Signal transduction histidine kinase CheA [hydrothermal vent metagenome]|uniref:histidine kinase n=1 Tax=hydrothermal vent metagenome TaxID=652676 RepID=A0A3B0ZFW1_9ZZZZ
MADSGFRHELDINTLSWVKSEIDTTLEQAQKALEVYEESPEDDSQIKFCLNYLHQVHGTLKMVELYGASLVAEELETLTLALSENKVSNKDETFQVLIKGMVQLPDYLEKLLGGQDDIPVVLLPLLNDMRAARGENLLTENALFSPNMDIAVPDEEAVTSHSSDGNIQELAKKLRHSYHVGLLHWFTEKNIPAGIKLVSKVVNELREVATDSEVNKLLWIVSGVMEGLREGGLESSIAVKLLAGNVDREIKKIIDQGENGYLKQPPKDLIKNLLYYVSCSSTNGDAVKSIKQAYKLQDIMPNTKVLEKARADLEGPNAALMQTVSTVLMDELTQVKDNLDIFVRSGNKDVEQLTPLVGSLSQMSDTLGMLGLGIQRATIREQKQRLDSMISGEKEITDSELMDVAGSLLSVENSLIDLGQLKGNKFNNDTVEQTLQEAEKQKLLKSVISEAKVDLSNVKESLSAFSRDPSNHELLSDIPAFLSQIQGSLAILNLTRASDLLDECNQFIQKDLISEQTVPELVTLETLADAISSIEYFLESLAENWGQPDAILEVAEQSLKKIRGDEFSLSDSNISNIDSAVDNSRQADDGLSLEIEDSNDTQEIGLETQVEIESSGLSLDDGTASEEFNLEPQLTLEVDNDPLDLTKDPESPPDNEGSPDPFDLGKLDTLPPTEELESSEARETIASEKLTAIAKLPDVLSTWFADNSNEENTNQLRNLFSEIKDQLVASKHENALKTVQDMEGVVNCVVSGEELLNDDLINTLNWAKDTLVDLISNDEISASFDIGDSSSSELRAQDDLYTDINPTEEIVTPTASEKSEAISVVEESSSKGRTFLADIDEEIIEIFLEEAQEEFDNIIRLFPLWKENANDDVSLKDMRRSFHTLKGSGRLVGAIELGEFAWSFENMLNHVVDGAIEITPIIYTTLEKAIQAFPVLFDQITSGEKIDHHILQLMEIAGALSLGKEVDFDNSDDQVDLVTAETPFDNDFMSEEFQINEDDIPDNINSENNLTQEITGFELDDVKSNISDLNSGELAEQNKNVMDSLEMDGIELGLPETDFSLESSDKQNANIELSTEKIVLDDNDINSEPLADNNEIELEADLSLDSESIEQDTSEIVLKDNNKLDIDPVLLDIYKNEAKTHIEAIHQYIFNWENENRKTVSADLVRALHTLKGSSRTASFTALADTCSEFEKIAKFLEENKLKLTPNIMAALKDNVAFAEAVIYSVENPDNEIPDHEKLYQQIIDLHHALIKDNAENVQAISVTPDFTPKDTEYEQQEQTTASHDYDEELLEIFLEEGVEILEDSDHCIHNWIDDRDNSSHIEALQRYLHTLKGGARMAGITQVGNLAHSTESILTAIVQNDIELNDDVFNILQKSHDQLLKMLEQIASRQTLDTGEQLLSQIDALISGEPIIDVAIEEELPTVEKVIPEQADIHNIIDVDDIDGAGDEIEEEFDESKLAGKISESLYENLSETSDIVDLHDNVTPIDGSGLPIIAEPVVADITPADKKEVSARRGSGEQVRVRSDLLDSLVNFAGEVSIYRSRMEQQVNTFRYNLIEFDDTVLRLRSQLRQFEIETETQMQSRYQNETGKTHADFDPLEFDRFTQMQQLSRGMLESLNDLDSLRGILSNLTRESETLLVQQSRVNTELQEGLMRTRMVPFSGQVSRLRRIVRQTAEELDKHVELKLSGVENEIDRTVLERILAPLEHMLRNAIAHGIESSEQRSENGKPEKGIIELIVDRDGSDLIVTVSDDGRGLDLDAIRDKALELGKIEADSNLSDQALFEMILEPGFSTATDITQISGRGVGMDVVNSEVQQLGGVFNIESQNGIGSKFSIRLPLTLSITRALMVNIADEIFALPLLSVQGIERIKSDQVAQLLNDKNSSYHWVGEDYKLIHLASEMGLAKVEDSEDNKMMPLLLVQSGEFRAAIVVDHLIGSREIVVKTIGPELSVLRGISGATIMGDGSVVLILDLSVLIQLTMAIDYESDLVDLIDETVENVPNIMVVDDSITVRKVTTRFLERNEMNVVTAKDGVDALAQLLDFIPDVMLLDVEMPRMDGFELANNMRNDDRLKNIPIIMITSRTGEKHRKRALDIGVNAYIGKPYQEIELLENIQNLLPK